MTKFCESLQEHTMEKINFKKKKMKLSTKKQQKSYQNVKICCICKKNFEDKHAKEKKRCKVIVYFHYTGEHWGAAHSKFNSKYSIPKEAPISFHNGSNYDCHLIIKVLAEEFERQFICLGENTEKYTTFSVSVQKEVARIDINGEEITKTITDYNLLIVQDLWQGHYEVSSCWKNL